MKLFFYSFYNETKHTEVTEEVACRKPPSYIPLPVLLPRFTLHLCVSWRCCWRLSHPTEWTDDV